MAGLISQEELALRREAQRLGANKIKVDRKALERLRSDELEPGEEVSVAQIEGNFKNSSPVWLMESMAELQGLFTPMQTELLNIADLMARDERQWTTVRRLILDATEKAKRSVSAYTRSRLLQALNGKVEENGQ